MTQPRFKANVKSNAENAFLKGYDRTKGLMDVVAKKIDVDDDDDNDALKIDVVDLRGLPPPEGSANQDLTM